MDDAADVAVRPMRRDDLAAFAAWGRHDDPLYRHYDVRALSAAERDDLWQVLAGAPAVRRPFVAEAAGEVVGSLVVRAAGAGIGEVGIVLDPRRLGRGLGRRILAAFAAVLTAEGYRCLRLDVAGYNARAIAAYRAAGFVSVGERWDDPEPGLDVRALLAGPAEPVLAPHVRPLGGGRYALRVVRMERRTDVPMKEES